MLLYARKRLPAPAFWLAVAIALAPAIVAAGAGLSSRVASVPAKPAMTFAMEVDTGRADGTTLSQTGCLQAAANAAAQSGYGGVVTSGGAVRASDGARALAISCPSEMGDPAFPYAMVSLSDRSWTSSSDGAADGVLQAIVGNLREALAKE